MKRRVFSKVFVSSFTAAALAVEKATPYSAVVGPPFKITVLLGSNSAGLCVSGEPNSLKVRKRQSRVVEVAADPANARSIWIRYVSDSGEIFELYPPDSFKLDPKGPLKVFVIKRDLGTRERGTSINDDPTYARISTWAHSPAGHCHERIDSEVHIEC